MVEWLADDKSEEFPLATIRAITSNTTDSALHWVFPSADRDSSRKNSGTTMGQPITVGGLGCCVHSLPEHNSKTRHKDTPTNLLSRNQNWFWMVSPKCQDRHQLIRLPARLYLLGSSGSVTYTHLAPPLSCPLCRPICPLTAAFCRLLYPIIVTA